MKYTLLAITALLISSCADIKSPSNPSPLSAEKQRFYKEWKSWNRMGIKDYSFTVTRFCFCPDIKPKFVEVRGGRVLLKKGSAPQKTISDYYKLIDKAYKQNAYRVKVKYDPRYHYPKYISIDYDKNIADEEVAYTIKGFLPYRKPQFNCPQVYEPVCGEIAVECITAPCPKIQKTFSNACFLKLNPRATFLHKGVCTK